MQEATQYLLGKHDFRNLCKMDVGNGVVSFERQVDLANVSLFCEDSLNKEGIYFFPMLIIIIY